MDEVIRVDNEDVFTMVRRLSKEEGILCGISSGANVWAAIQYAQRPETVGNDGDHPGFQPYLLFGKAGFAARGPDHFGEL